jgi:hypothetical protein
MHLIVGMPVASSLRFDPKAAVIPSGSVNQPCYAKPYKSLAYGPETENTSPASGQSCPTRTGILIFKYIILKIKYNALQRILVFKYNKVACRAVFLVFKYSATTALASSGLPTNLRSPV